MRISFPASPRIAELTTGGYSPRAAAIIKQIPGIVRAHGSNRYLMGRDAAELFAEQWAAAGLRGDFERADPLAYAPAGSAHLRDYQREAVGFLLGERQCILADSMGLGKTRSAIEALKLSGIARALVVAPSYVVGVWENELRKWSLDVEKECYVLGGKTRLTVRAANTKPARGDGVRDLPERGLCVIGYDVLAAWSERLAAWAPEACVFDEAHYLMSSFSKRTKAASAVCHAADYRWALTGTPLTNRPRDLWSLCEVIRPSGFGSFFNFCSRYCNAHQEQVTPLRVVWNFDGRSNLEELNRRLRHFMLRRTARDVALQLPPKTRQIIKVPVKSAKIIDGEMSAAAMRASLNVAADAKLPIAASTMPSATLLR
jgi:SNF2 family DNA or RNA helicase